MKITNLGLDDLIDELVEKLNTKFPVPEWDDTKVTRFTKETRDKWTIIKKHNSGVYCFIARVDLQTKGLGTVKLGDIHKPASWRAPAKHRRGSVLADDRGLSCCGPYGVNCMR